MACVRSTILVTRRVQLVVVLFWLDKQRFCALQLTMLFVDQAKKHFLVHGVLVSTRIDRADRRERGFQSMLRPWFEVLS